MRRRRIALAWEGINPPDDRLTTREKSTIGFLWMLMIVFVTVTGYLIYDIETSRFFGEFKAIALHDEGRQLSDDEANALERRLKRSPADPETRLKLLGFYWERHKDARKAKDDERIAAEMQRQIPHARYFIENLPGHMYTDLASTAMPYRTDDPDYAAISDLWREQIDRLPEDADVLWNASGFFRKLDDDYCEQLLERGRTLEPSEVRWPEELDALRIRRAEAEQ